MIHTDNWACFSQVDKFILVSLDYPGSNSAFDTTICYEVDMFCFTSLGHTDNCACFSQVDTSSYSHPWTTQAPPPTPPSR